MLPLTIDRPCDRTGGTCAICHDGNFWATALAGAAIGSGSALGQQPPAFDLVIRGGEVIDPSQGLRGIRDVGIRFGQIAAVEASIPATRAKQTIDAKGRLVTPGLVDLHAHV